MEHPRVMDPTVQLTDRIEPIKSPHREDPVVVVGPAQPPFVKQPLGERNLRVVEIDDLIARADEYVTIGADGNAVIARAIENVMTPAEIEHVETLVTLHNLRPHRHKPFHRDRPPMPPLNGADGQSDTGTSSQALGGDPAPPPCTPGVTFNAYWWGFRIYMNHCFCDALTIGGVINTGAAAVIAGLFVQAGLSFVNPWIALAAGLIALMIAWILWADRRCNNGGANYNQSWTVQGWITTVC